MKIRYMLTMLCCLTIGKINAQEQIGSKETYAKIPDFRIGEQVPDLPIIKLINSSIRNTSTRDFKDLLLIIDFWETSCASCIAGMPKMDALQKKFGNKIKILPVSQAPEDRIQSFWKTNKYTKDLSLPSVVEDKALNTYFLHVFIPHEVWIYKGKIIAITDGQQVNENNIQKALDGIRLNIPVKNDFYMFDAQKESLFKPDSNQIDPGSTFIKYVAISDYKEKNGASAADASGADGIVRDPKHKTVRAYIINTAIHAAYIRNWIRAGIDQNKFIKPQSANENTVAWEVKDKSKYRYDYLNTKIPLSDWNRDHSICYESLNPDTGQTDQQIAEAVITDLNRLLGLNVRWDKRKEKVLVLVRNAQPVKLGSWESIPKENRLFVVDIDYYMNMQASNPYVFNETGYQNQEAINMKITNWTDIAAIRKTIAPYGLELREEERLVDKFIFSEVNGSLLADDKMIGNTKATKQ